LDHLPVTIKQLCNNTHSGRLNSYGKIQSYLFPSSTRHRNGLLVYRGRNHRKRVLLYKTFWITRRKHTIEVRSIIVQGNVKRNPGSHAKIRAKTRTDLQSWTARRYHRKC